MDVYAESGNGKFDSFVRDETSVWSSEVIRNHVGYFIYILIIPIFCVFGIITNSLNAIIFSRPRMVSSSYIYFTGTGKRFLSYFSIFYGLRFYLLPLKFYFIILALSCLDLLSCLLLFLSCLARTEFRMTVGWRRFDLFCYLPISAITTTASNFITLAVVIGNEFCTIL